MIYAIGDIHGHLDLLTEAHRRISEDRAAHGGEASPVVHIGDLVDRGPDAKGVIQFLIDGRDRGEDWIVLTGNHDRMFLNVLDGGDGTHERLRKGVTWQHNVMGGRATLESYGLRRKFLEREERFLRRVRAVVPEAHAAFLRSLPLWYELRGMIFVHAGIRPGFPMDAQDEDDLLWIRDEFLWHPGDHDKLIVHGHTPVEEPTHYGNRINIDTGAGWGNDLVPVVLDGGSWYALGEDGRQELKVPKHAHRVAAITARQ